MAEDRICSISDCGKPVLARGWCNSHWKRWRKHDDPLGAPVRQTVCSVPDCGGAPYGHGYCSRHYQRWVRHGGPEKGGTGKGAPAKWLKENLRYDQDDCLIWPFGRNVVSGYPSYVMVNRLYDSGHRHMCRLVHGDPPDGMDASHSCGAGQSGCVNPQHLRWATRSENMRDTLTHGTSNRGNAQGYGKLSPDDVHVIYQRLAGGDKQDDIAADYQITQSMVAQIKSGNRWGWLTRASQRVFRTSASDAASRGSSIGSSEPSKRSTM
jgi:uncharacterized protein (DUF433 family)